MKFLKHKCLVGLAVLGALGGAWVPQVALAGDQPYIGEIAWVAFNFEPVNWAFCDGRMLNIADNPTLYTVLGTTYGGDGQTTFALPDLRGRSPLHAGTLGGNNYPLGQQGGEESHILTVNELPGHNHLLQVDPREATAATPGNATSYLAKTSRGTSAYGSTANASLAPTAIGSAGGNQPHDNMKPYLALNCIISLYGIFPSQN